MSCPLTGNEAGLVGYWNFNEGSGSTVTDLTSNGNNGTINGASWSTQTPNQYCNNCTATDSVYVQVQAPTTLDLGSDTNLICAGTSETLDAGTGFSSYLWSDGSTNQTLDVATAGTYSVTGTDANGCSASDSMVIDVLNVDITQNDTTICEGDSLELNVIYSSENTETIQQMDEVWSYTFKNLNPSETYKLKVSGLWNICCGHFDSDIAYTGITFGNIYPINQMSGWGSNLGVFINGSASVRPNPDIYNSEHIYFYDIPPNSDSIKIEFTDSPTTDNIGSLKFEILNQGDNILWSTGETISSITVFPTSTTTYTVDVTSGTTTCQSDVTISVNQRDLVTLDSTACDSIQWDGNWLASSGTYVDTIQNVAGCDSIVTLNLTIHNAASSDTNATACDSFVWYGNTYIHQWDHTRRHYKR